MYYDCRNRCYCICRWAPPVKIDSKSGIIPPSGSLEWEQPKDCKSFRLSVWNRGGQALKVTLTYSDGKREACNLKPGLNKVIAVNNTAPAGRYNIDFMTLSGVMSGEYGVSWSAEAFVSEVPFISEMSPIPNDSNYGHIPAGSTSWKQPDDCGAFCVRVWNQGKDVLKIALTYPDGRKEELTQQPGVNKVIYVENNASAGKYELNFSTPSDVVTGEYEVTWSTVSL